MARDPINDYKRLDIVSQTPVLLIRDIVHPKTSTNRFSDNITKLGNYHTCHSFSRLSLDTVLLYSPNDNVSSGTRLLSNCWHHITMSRTVDKLN